LTMHPDLAWVYLSALAELIAERNRLVPVTDQSFAHVADRGWTAERTAAVLLGKHYSPPAVDAALVGTLALQLVVPADLSNLPVSTVVKLRLRYGADFDAFHSEVAAVTEALSTELLGIRDHAVLERYLRDAVDRRFRRHLIALRAIMRGVRTNAVLAAMNTRFELPAAVATGGLVTGHPVLAGAGAVTFAVTSFARARYQERTQATQPSAYSYLWRIDNATKRNRLVRRVHRSVRMMR
jgi:Family of unknown function (DUF6236)